MKVFVTTTLRDSIPEAALNSLKLDFSEYKRTGELPVSFGRDVRYDHQNTPKYITDQDLQHIHLNPERKRGSQYLQVSNVAHLVYCEGYNDPSTYCLIALLEPDPHSKALDDNVMRPISEAAAKFREEH